MMLKLKEASKTPQIYPVMVILDNSSLPPRLPLSLLGSCRLITVRLWSLLSCSPYPSISPALKTNSNNKHFKTNPKKSSFIPGWFSRWYFLPSLLSLPKLK